MVQAKKDYDDFGLTSRRIIRNFLEEEYKNLELTTFDLANFGLFEQAFRGKGRLIELLERRLKKLHGTRNVNSNGEIEFIFNPFLSALLEEASVEILENGGNWIGYKKITKIKTGSFSQRVLRSYLAR